MTRKLAWSLLLCFSQIAALPGCLHLPYFAKVDETRTINDSMPTKPIDLTQSKDIEPPTAVSDFASWASNQASDPKKSASAPPEQSQEPGLHPLPKLEAELTKLTAPKTGVVTVEGPLSAKEVTAQKAPLPLAEKKRDFPLLQVIQAMLEKRHDDALQYLGAYDRDTQEFILRLLPPLILVMQKPINELTRDEIAVVNEQIRNAQIMAQSRCELTVSKICFCKQVRGFGLYDPLPDNHAFVAGTKTRLGDEVQLYVELKNLRSEKMKDGGFATRLACTVAVQDATGKTVWSRPFERGDTAQHWRTQLNDFHRNYTFYVPILPPGTYLLTVQMTDETNAKQPRVARKSIDFRVTPVAN